MAQTYPTISFRDYRIYWVHRATTPEARERIARFWLDNKAIGDAAEAERRAHEVGCLVVNQDAEIVGVNTVYEAALGDKGRRYWFYRTFVRPDARTTGLSTTVFRFTAKKLGTAPREGDAPQGIVVVAENPKFARPGGRRRLQRLGMRSIGTSPRGQEVWVLDFEVPQPSPASTV
jgi:GNAT superfamily N-acetyltransferase